MWLALTSGARVSAWARMRLSGYPVLTFIYTQSWAVAVSVC